MKNLSTSLIKAPAEPVAAFTPQFEILIDMDDEQIYFKNGFNSKLFYVIQC